MPSSELGFSHAGRGGPVVAGALRALPSADGTWRQPKFVENVRHMLPNRKHVWVRSGTQYIDQFWRHLRKGIKPFTKAVAKTLRKKVRATQWRYTHMGEDLWIALGLEIAHAFS